jgi:hypothetical protein
MTAYVFRLSAPITVLWFGFVVIAVAQLHPSQVAEENVSVPAEGESVPMLDFGGRPVVEVMINDKGPYNFVFDTGASMTVIDSSVAKELSLESSAQLRELRVGRVTIHGLEGRVAPISQMFGADNSPRGVLSASSFPGYLVTFDYPGKRLLFRKGSLGEENGKGIFSYDPAGLPAVPVKVASREVSLHLDTGAPFTIALPTKYMKELPLSAAPVQKGHAKTHVGSLPIFQATLDGDISIGDYKVPTRDLHFTDVVPYPGAEPRGQVGNDALRGLIVTLDSKNHRVQLEKPAGTMWVIAGFVKQ